MNKFVYVTWDPLIERVICVHTTEDGRCDKCTKILNEDRGAYFLKVDKFKVNEDEQASVEETTVSSVDGGRGMDTDVSTSQKTLVFSVGIQGSGKSTFFKVKSPVIETDAIRKEVFNNVDNLSDERLIFDIAINRIVKELETNDTVYFDATMVETQHRQSFLLELKELVPNIKFIGILFPTDPEIAKERIQADLSNGVDRADAIKFVDEYVEYYNETLSLIAQDKVLFKAVMNGHGGF
jgi:hypothetical protein